MKRLADAVGAARDKAIDLTQTTNAERAAWETGHATLDQLRTSVALAAAGFGDLGMATARLQATLDVAKWMDQADAIRAARAEAQKSEDVTKRLREYYADQIGRLAELTGRSHVYSEVLKRVGVDTANLTEEQARLVEQITRAGERMARFERVRAVVGQIQDVFRAAFEGALLQQQNFGQAFLSGFKALLARMLAEWAASQVGKILLGIAAPKGLDDVLKGTGTKQTAQIPGLPGAAPTGGVAAGAGATGTVGAVAGLASTIGGLVGGKAGGTASVVGSVVSGLASIFGGKKGAGTPPTFPGGATVAGGVPTLPNGAVPVFIIGSAQWGDAGAAGGGGMGLVGTVASLIPGLGALGGVLKGIGGLFGKRALGGTVEANRAYLVGEHGPEIVAPKSGGNVIPAAQTTRMLAALSAGQQQPAARRSGAATSSEIESAVRRAMATSGGKTEPTQGEPTPTVIHENTTVQIGSINREADEDRLMQKMGKRRRSAALRYQTS